MNSLKRIFCSSFHLTHSALSLSFFSFFLSLSLSSHPLRIQILRTRAQGGIPINKFCPKKS
jgi:hypothetical protein